MTVKDERQPKRNHHIPGGEHAEVPAGLQMLLYQAARDDQLRRELLADRTGTVERSGLTLQSSELATLHAVSDDVLARMIDRLVPQNPRGRSVMRQVAVAVASLAAGTAAGTVIVSCEEALDGGVGPSTWVDGTGGSAGEGGAGGGGAAGLGGSGGSGGAEGGGGAAGMGGVGSGGAGSG